jgi:hypothetical protein
LSSILVLRFAATGDVVRIIEHRKHGIVEVLYPASAPTALQHADYTIRAKLVIEKQRGAWGLLVDQRALPQFDDKLKAKMLTLYTYAIKKGMIGSARIVNNSLEALRLTEWLRTTELRTRVRFFTERKEAFDWLTDALRAASP